jgi:hypothetical protein
VIDAKDARDHWGRVLMRYIRSLRPKVTGGVMLFQVGSDRSPDEYRERCFRYEFFFLGEVTLPTERDVTNFKIQLGMPPSKQLRIVLLGSNHCSSLPTSIVPADQPHALRYLLFGSPYKYPVHRLGISVNKAVDCQYGLQGAAALQPWYIYTPEQFWAYYFQTKGIRLFDLFGNWRGHRRRRRSRHRDFPSQDGRRGVLLRQSAFRRKNESRRKETLDRRQQLIGRAKPIFNKLRGELGRSLGSPRLKRAMADMGQPISDRDARWLVKHFASQVEPSTTRACYSQT